MYYLSIACARKSIFIANPYFIPDRPAIKLLTAARRRGVDVKIMVSGIHNDNFLARRNSTRLYGPLLAVLALLTWAYLTSMALHLGLAFAAQLEAAQAGVRKPEHRRVVTPPEGRSEQPKRRAG